MAVDNSTSLDELLSSAVDAETSDWELRRLLKTDDPELREKWAGYQMASQVLRRDEIKGIDISSAVHAAIADEKPSVKPKFAKPLAQFAVAASVAAVSLLGVQQYQLAQMDASPMATSEQIELADTGTSEALDPVFLQPQGFYLPEISTQNASSTFTSAQPQVEETVSYDEAALKAHFQRTLNEYSSQATQTTQSVLPLVRQVPVRSVSTQEVQVAE